MAQVSLILLDDVENLGLAGDEVHVAPGYARNFLLPRKLACNLSRFERLLNALLAIILSMLTILRTALRIVEKLVSIPPGQRSVT